jgi:hypothetical protein
MPSLYEQYIGGAYSEVWDELRRLGGDVRQAGTIEDATAVTRETVRRAKLNLATVVQRLTALGYAFDSELTAILRNPPKNISKRLAAFEAALGGKLPLILTSWYEQVGSISLMGSHPVLCPQTPGHAAGSLAKLSAEQLRSIQTQVTPDPFVMSAFDGSSLGRFRHDNDPAQRLRQAQARLREFEETMARTRESTAKGFPDVFAKIEQRLAPQRDQLEQAVRDAGKPVAFHLELGPDDIMKFGESGDSYYVALPDTGADFIIRGTGPEETFVAYLRRSFRCGGFAGWDGLPNIPPALVELGARLLPI